MLHAFKTITAGLVLAGLVTGCAFPTFSARDAARKASERAADSAQEFAQRATPAAAVREHNEPYLEFKRVQKPAARGDVNVKAASTPFAALVSEISRQAGYSVVLSENVEANRPVSVEFNHAVAEDAIRTVAFLAGYAAVVDRNRRTVTIAEEATYTFKLPAGVFGQLQAVYEAGGNPASTASGSGSSGGGGGGMRGSSVKSSFTISGRDGTTSASVQRLITEVAGANAKVTVTEMGYITVRANGQALRRISDFLKQVATDAMTQVDIEAAVIEVELSNEFVYGISWEKVLRFASGVQFDFATVPTQVLGANLSVMRTGASSKTIIQALNRFTDVRVVSQPRLFTMNNTPANFMQGTQVPYLGDVQQTAGTLGSAPTTSGSVAFAIDGLSFGVVPSVIDTNNVQISLMPVISALGELEQFNLGEATLKAYRQSNKQSFMRVMAESGQTLVLGGIRTGSAASTTALLSSTQARNTASETVILLRATVVPSPDYNPLVGESI